MIHFVLKSNLLGVLAAIAVACVVYGVLLLKLRCVDEKELLGLPGGGKMVNIARKFHLL